MKILVVATVLFFAAAFAGDIEYNHCKEFDAGLLPDYVTIDACPSDNKCVVAAGQTVNIEVGITPPATLPVETYNVIGAALYAKYHPFFPPLTSSDDDACDGLQGGCPLSSDGTQRIFIYSFEVPYQVTVNDGYVEVQLTKPGSDVSYFCLGAYLDIN